jgi:glucose-1-phosphate thymidylyltransferase
MKAIILAGGIGSRLYPLTRIASKQLQAVYDKPMIFYPLTALIAAGIREFCLISDPVSLPAYKNLLGSGVQLGINIDYREQAKPEGIAQAFLIAADFIGTDCVTLMLGDNIFSGGDDLPRAIASFKGGALIFAYQVKDPQRYGVVQFTPKGEILSLEEKPAKPKSNFAVPGVYIFDHQVVSIAKSIKPSARGELEVTDINLEYLRRGQLQVHRLSRGFAWLDAGTSGALQEASVYIEAIERRQGVKIGCPEEAALVRGFISLSQFKEVVRAMPNCEYRDYLNLVANDFAEHN